MKKTKLTWIITGAMLAGIGVGSIAFPLSPSKADSNVVLASVEWVQSLINPVTSKVSQLETKIAAQDKEIASLKSQVAALGKPTATTPTTPVTTPPVNQETKLPQTVYILKDTAKVYSGASKSYKVLATFKKGAALKVDSSITVSTGVWYKVVVNSKVKGWIQAAEVTTSQSSATLGDQPLLEELASSVVTKSSVNLRSGATTSYKVLETIPSGMNLVLIQQFTNNKGETWYNVQTQTGNKGWMIASLGEVK